MRQADMCVWGVWVNVGLEGLAVICVLSAALRRLTHRDVFHPLSPLCTKSRRGFNMELNTCCLRRRTVSALHLDAVLPDTVTLCSLCHVVSVTGNQTPHTCGWKYDLWKEAAIKWFVCVFYSLWF